MGYYGFLQIDHIQPTNQLITGGAHPVPFHFHSPVGPPQVREAAPTPSDGHNVLPTPPMAPAERNKVAARGSSVPSAATVEPCRD